LRKIYLINNENENLLKRKYYQVINKLLFQKG